MILEKFENIVEPTIEIWKKIGYKNIEAKNKLNLITNNKKLIHNFDDDIDTFVLNAINYYDNLNLFIVFGKNKNETYKYFIEHFSNNYTLYGIKFIKIKQILITKIMYQLLFSRMIIKNKNELFKYLEEEYTYLHQYNKEYIDITILFVCKKDLNEKYPINDIISSNFCVYIPNTKETIWNAASIFFCEKSLDFIEKQNFDYFLTKDMEKSKKMFLKYRKWLNTNIDYKDQSSFMLFSSIVLYLLGHRSMNDVDLYIHNISDQLIEKTDQLKNNVDYNFVEYNIKNTEKWPLYWDIWLDEWAIKCGAKYFEDILCNQKYHFYFLGVKIISLECDIIRRIERNRPRAVADLIALRKRYHFKINIPPIPKKTKKYISITDKSPVEIKTLIDSGGILNEKNKEILVENDSDIDKFIGTIIYALQTRYKMIFTTEEIKKELNMGTIDQSFSKRIKIIIKKKE